MPSNAHFAFGGAVAIQATPLRRLLKEILRSH